MNTFKQLFEAFESEMNWKEKYHLKILHNELTSHYTHVTSDENQYPHYWDKVQKSKYTEGNINAIHLYTDGSEINHYLWDKHEKPDNFKPHKIKDVFIKGLDHALDKVKTPRDFHVYSNTKMNPIGKVNGDNVLHHPAYISTSINNRFPRHWGQLKKEDNIIHRHILKIHVPKDHPGVYVGDHISTCPDQHEFILPRGLNLKYKGTKILKDLNYMKTVQHHHIHEMEIV